MDRKINGFTLVEIILSIVILAIVASVVGSLLSTTTKSFSASIKLADADNSANLSLIRIESELRSAQTIVVATAAEVQFTKADGGNITFKLVGTVLQRIDNILSSTQVLSNNVTQFLTQYYDNNGAVTAVLANIRYVKINFAVTEQSQVATLETVIYARNIV